MGDRTEAADAAKVPPPSDVTGLTAESLVQVSSAPKHAPSIVIAS
jgi:hypothetical protein